MISSRMVASSACRSASALAVVLFAVVGFVLAYTRLGRQIYAFGGDPHAATMAGLPTTRVILFTYV